MYLEIRINLRSVLLDFQSFIAKPVFECAFLHPMMLFYHIWVKTLWIASTKNMKRLRGERREQTSEINQNHWRAKYNHHCLYLENHVF